ncbi:transmembrane protease serine 11A [Lepeophtheirus salmonis]|uniref:transmembrane protease serine 11A n=1 Tax=Lepeophtheirus salmonis TaxID=72036 RepID=UPI001AE799DB|nr:transmembrane protease serine 11A-like [Lepeophtheirus salmonis]
MSQFLKSLILVFCLSVLETSCEKPYPRERDCKCGKEDVSSRIIGGTKASQNYPWIIQIFVEVPETTDTNLCSGTIISNKYVLTAGHCFVHDENGKSTKIPKSNIKVSILNAKDKWSLSDIRSGKIELKNNEINKIIIHEKFSIEKSGAIVNDIALVKFKKDFSKILEQQNKPRKFMPICLPMNQSKYVNREASIIGWGLLDFKNKSSIAFDGLKEAKVNILSNQDKRCKKIVFSNSDPSKILCAYRENYDACEGDSGGPLMLKTRFPHVGMRYSIIGIVSYGLKCGVREQAGVYTRISGYLNWIQEHSKGGLCNAKNES